MIKAVLIDDEVDATESLQKMLEGYCKNVEVVGVAHSAEAAVKVIMEKKPNLVFLDIEMPGGSGFDLLKKLPERNFDVIFATAYDHYALKAIKYSALDYILKPIDIDDLVAAVDKVDQSIKQNGQYKYYDTFLENVDDKSPKKVALPTSDGLKFIPLANIVRVEASGSYSIVYFSDGAKSLMISKTLKDVEELISNKKFFRLHNSHIVNIDHVTEYKRTDGGFVLLSDNSRAEISRRKKDAFLEIMKLKI